VEIARYHGSPHDFHWRDVFAPKFVDLREVVVTARPCGRSAGRQKSGFKIKKRVEKAKSSSQEAIFCINISVFLELDANLKGLGIEAVGDRVFFVLF
jgi:hypothetical protein